MAGSFDAAVSDVAKDQQRNITRAQLLLTGLAPNAILHRVKTGRLHHTRFPGVYAVGTPIVTPHERAYAAILACGSTARLSHASAMVLNGVWHRWEEPLEVTLTEGDRRMVDDEEWAWIVDKTAGDFDHLLIATTVPWLLSPGLDTAYTEGRDAFEALPARPSFEAVHDLRKRGKDLWYQLRLLRDAWPAVLEPTL